VFIKKSNQSISNQWILFFASLQMIAKVKNDQHHLDNDTFSNYK